MINLVPTPSPGYFLPYGISQFSGRFPVVSIFLIHVNSTNLKPVASLSERDGPQAILTRLFKKWPYEESSTPILKL